MIKIALVGRPNVGKSALFNRIVGKRVSIVDEREGVTRDRIYGKAELFNTPFEVIDTGGIDARSQEPLHRLVKRQTEIAIEEADALIMVVDAQVGVTTLDEEVARLIRALDKPVCLAVNKVDSAEQEGLIAPFFSLGIKRLVAVSASHGLHMAELLEPLVTATAKRYSDIADEDKPLRIALIGRTNVGKSTLLNTLLSEERSLVSDQAGTTRDAIDAQLKVGNRLFEWIDTAGIRRKKAEKEVVEKFAALRTERAIKRADICLVVLDACAGLTAQEKRMLSLVEAAGKGCLLLFNKWDLVSGYQMEPCLRAVRRSAPFTEHCPTLFGSAKTGKSLNRLFPLLEAIDHDRTMRIPTGELNHYLEKAIQKNPPPMQKGRRLRIYYLTQIGVAPPRFVLFVNAPSLMTSTYQKYLVNQLRATYRFQGTPLFFHLKKKAPQNRPKPKPLAKATAWNDIVFASPEREGGPSHTLPS